MAELGFASRILKITTGPMDDVARTLAATGRQAGPEATALEQFTANVGSARRLYDDVIDDAYEIGTYPPAIQDSMGGLRGLIGQLDAAHLQPVRHRAMGHADTARAAAGRVLDRLDEAASTGAHADIANPKIGSPLFQDLWALRNGLDEAWDSAGAAKVLGDWR